MNHRPTDQQTPTTATNMTGGISELAHDVVTLAELQLKLMRLDVQESARRMVGPIVGLVVAGVVAMGCVPVLLMGLAYGLAETTTLSLAGGALVAGVIGLLLAGLSAYLAWRRLRCCSVQLDRSRKELTQNVNWIMQAVSRPGQLASGLRPRQESY